MKVVNALNLRSPREVAIFVVRGDRFLVTRRVPPDGYWHVVAGQVEVGEAYQEAAPRELHEETGLADVPLVDLGLRQVYAMTDEFRSSYPPGTAEVTIENFSANAPEGWEPRLNHEHDDYRWCVLGEALGLLHWPEARRAIALIAQRFGTQ